MFLAPQGMPNSKSFNILLIRPRPSPDTIGLQHIMVVEPLELEILAASTSKDDKVVIIDMILEKRSIQYFLHKFNPDIVCVTGYITHIPSIKEICVSAKNFNPDTTTIVGGVHAECFPNDLDFPEVDYRVIRNATIAFPALLDLLRENRLTIPPEVLLTSERANPSALPDFNFSMPLPRRDLTAKYRRKYFYVFHDKVALLKTSFGCPFRCEFCFCRRITNDKYFARPLEDVITELERIEEKEVYIVDDDFLYSPHRVVQFLDLIEENELDKKFMVYGRADFIARYPGIIKRCKKLG